MFCVENFIWIIFLQRELLGSTLQRDFLLFQKVFNFIELTLQPLSVSWVTAQISVGLLSERSTVSFRFSQRLEQRLCIELVIVPFLALSLPKFHFDFPVALFLRPKRLWVFARVLTFPCSACTLAKSVKSGNLSHTRSKSPTTLYFVI